MLKSLLVSICVVAIWIGQLTASCEFCAGQQDQTQPNETKEVQRSREEIQQIKQAVITAFAATHDGWSSDEVLINDELNQPFIAHCQKDFPDGQPLEFNWTLLNLRKANELTAKATKRSRTEDADFRHAAEIAVRSLHDKYGASIDRVMADPRLRAEFDEAAISLAPNVSAYELRKAALALRKARQLRPELIVRIADWGREVKKFSAQDISKNLELVPTSPGVYIFSDSTGYLYIGEASNLRERLKKHLEDSDRQSLAKYLTENGKEQITIEYHAFDPASQAKSKPVRRAYESELIRSRNPRFNIAP